MVAEAKPFDFQERLIEIDRFFQGTDPLLPLVAGQYVKPGPCAMNCTNNAEPYSFHKGGINALFADGSIHFLSETMPLYFLFALYTRNAGEVIPSGFYN